MEEKENRVKSVLGGKKKSPKAKKAPKAKAKKGGGRKPSAMHIRRSANGGYIARHEFDDKEPMQANEEHVLPDHDALMDHVAEHMQPQEQMAAAPAPNPKLGMM